MVNAKLGNVEMEKNINWWIMVLPLFCSLILNISQRLCRNECSVKLYAVTLSEMLSRKSLMLYSPVSISPASVHSKPTSSGTAPTTTGFPSELQVRSFTEIAKG